MELDFKEGHPEFKVQNAKHDCIVVCRKSWLRNLSNKDCSVQGGVSVMAENGFFIFCSLWNSSRRLKHLEPWIPAGGTILKGDGSLMK